MSLTIPVIKLIQKNVTIYVGRITAKQILATAYIHEWDPGIGWDPTNSGQGYQRSPIPDHYRRIAAFLIREGSPLLPTAAVLSAREMELGVLPFNSISTGSPFGHLEIPDGHMLVIIDYQHRWRALQYGIETLGQSGLADFEFPVIILANATRFEEMRQFYLINSKQKRVDSDLALTLMHAMAADSDEKELLNLVGPGNRYKIRATRVLVKIMRLTTGPWADRIEEPNMIYDPNRVASMKSFVDSLRPLTGARSPVAHLSDDEVVDLIIRYWDGISRILLDAFRSPAEYTIQGSVGLFVMHRVARHVFETATNPTALTASDIASKLQKSRTYMTEAFWRTSGGVGQYSSGAGHKQLADLMKGEL